MPKQPRSPREKTAAQRADRHILYQRAVQNVEAEIDFVDDTFKKLRHRRASRLREDFCGTAATSCEWVRRRPTNTAVGLDLDQPTLDWGTAHNLSELSPSALARITLLRRDVLNPGPQASGMDAVLAMNFSFWVFKTRPLMLRYFRAVHRSLVPGGIFFLDFYGGYEAMKEMRERRKERWGGGFTYIWDQHKFNPITGDMTCRIHFSFPDGSRLRNAFTYDWRLWTLPEIRDILADAGFKRSTVYWEGDDGRGGGNGEFTPTDTGEACASWITYLVAEK
jgi:SAM-dependent methyltransferase